MTLRVILVSMLTAALLLIMWTQAPADTPTRQLVYSFNYGSQQATTARTSSNIDRGDLENPSSAHITSGSNTYRGTLGDRGTMTVDIMREQPDKGLIVVISEQGRDTRSAPPATCVAYGNTSVICEPDKKVNPEEYTLLRFLASNFVDPNQLDAHRHWSIRQEGSGLVVDASYTIERNDAGTMTIGEVRTVKEPLDVKVSTDVQTKIGYDFGRLGPTSIDEYVTQRQDNGPSGTTTTIYQTSLKLVSDSSVAKP